MEKLCDRNGPIIIRYLDVLFSTNASRQIPLLSHRHNDFMESPALFSTSHAHQFILFF